MVHRPPRPINGEMPRVIPAQAQPPQRVIVRLLLADGGEVWMPGEADRWDDEHVRVHWGTAEDLMFLSKREVWFRREDVRNTIRPDLTAEQRAANLAEFRRTRQTDGRDRSS